MFARCLLTPRASLKCGPLTGQARTLYSSKKVLSTECAEVEIEVPWGKIAGKLWGQHGSTKQPILALHGWQDNASSFDNLAPLLLKHGPILAIDWPGHGTSSWLPPGHMYTEYVYLTVIERLRRHFDWKMVKGIGHSMAAHYLFWYASFFPQQVEFVVALDSLKPVMLDFTVYYNQFRKLVDGFFKLDGMNNDAWTKEELVKKWKEVAITAIEDETIETLFDRGTVRTDDGRFVPSRDPRVKLLPYLNSFLQDNANWLAGRVSCPYLFIKAKDSPYLDLKQNTTDVLEIMKKHNKNVHDMELPGQHHIHITNATDVARHVNTFLDKYNT